MATSKFTALFVEARRRRVFRGAALYVVGAWVVLQIADLAFPGLGIPESAIRYVWIGAILGFPIALVCGWRYDLVGGRIVRTEEKDSDANLSLRRTDYLILSALTIVAVSITAGLLDEITGTQETRAVQQPFGEVVANSIAVLPFRNRSALSEDAFFVDGIHDDILTQLAKLSSLEKVISRTSVERYRDTTIPMQQIGRELAVAAILEGGVQRAGNRVRINVQLIGVQREGHLWAETYDRELTAENLFAIQSEISQKIATALHVVMTADETERLQTQPTTSLEAYGEFVLGRQELAKRTADSVQRAYVHFENAVELDSDYVLAYVGLADALSLRADYGDTIGSDTLAPRQAAIDKALTLDPVSGEAFTSLADLKKDRDEDAEPDFLKAMELSPNYANAYKGYSVYLRNLDRNKDALQLIRKALELDPMAPVLTSILASVLENLDRFEDAREALITGIERNPEFTTHYLGMAEGLWKQGRIGEALKWARAGMRFGAPNRLIVVSECNLYLELGDDDAAERCIASAIDAFPDTATILSANLHIFRLEFREATDVMEQLVQREPSQLNHYYLVLSYLDSGEPHKAESIIQELWPDLYGDVVTSDTDKYLAAFAAYTLYVDGKRDRANEMFEQILDIIRSEHISDCCVHGGAEVFIHVARGDKQKAISALREYLRTTWWQYWWELRSPRYDSMQDEPGWIDLMSKLEGNIAQQRQWYEKYKDDPLF